MDTKKIPPSEAGDPFTAKAPKPDEERLAVLEDRYRHELMDDDERQELRGRIARIRREIGLEELTGGGWID